MRLETLLEKNLLILMKHQISYLMVFPSIPDEAKAEHTELAACLRQMHPYSLPEIIALPVTQGSQAYLNWLKNTATKS